MAQDQDQEKTIKGIDRREFIRLGLLTGATALTLSQISQVANNSASVAAYAEQPFELAEATISEMQAAIMYNKYSARELAERYLARIKELDRQGPELRSVIEVNPDALQIAEQLDKERKEKGVRGPLHGIPILIKDNIDTADRMTTTAGSLALKGSIAPQDSFVAAKLREAGAVILGKTNLSEWANFRSSRSSSGWSGRGGQCRNPYALDRSPSGSSSGSAVAVAANLCAAAIGTETDGSIVSPASINSIVGIKPTLGLISRAGIIPIAHSQDTAGPMARTVRDAVFLLGALTGVDPRDSATANNKDKALTDYSKFLDLNGLKGARIGVVRTLFGYHEQVDELINQRLEDLKSAGAVLVDPVNIETVKQIGDSEIEVLLYEFKADLNAYLATLNPNITNRTLKDLIEFNNQNRATEMPFFGQEFFISAEAKGTLKDKKYLMALAKNQRLTRKEGIDLVMEKNRLDALVAPSNGPSWPIDLLNGDHYSGGSSTLAAVAGYPHITVPAGYLFGLPIGISFFGRAYSEPTLIRIAYAFEQITKVRQPPRFLPTVDFQS